MTHVRPSLIHGLGLFAERFIPAGALIGRIEGVPIFEDGPYVLWLDESRAIEVTNEMRYINHADHPNAAYYDDLTIIALRNIQPGEEITHDYACEQDGAGIDFAA